MQKRAEQIMLTKQEALQHYFGYQEFREGQEEVVDAILSGRDTLGIMPTGGGKSLCFQLPALLMPGITLVISPLISLMKDQVTFLTQNGIRGAYLNSSLTYRQYRAALRNAKEGRYKIIYLAPERLLTPEFLEFAQQAQISMVTVDEAHCVSQWGQDFRPSYLLIAPFLKKLPQRPVVSAFTATATPRVKEDILSLLSLESPYVAFTSFNRKNLYFEVKKSRNKLTDLRQIVAERPGKSGIIYCATRKAVEKVCFALREWGFPATQYHAGLSDDERKENQEAFVYDHSPIMVATNAFGMGIDKSNVSFVVHYNMPKDMESYYQEAGRAGRDGENADCILLYSSQDEATNRYLISLTEENEELSPKMKELVLRQNEARLQAMIFFCHTTECLRHCILRYFGEQAPTACGNCGSCVSSFEETDITKTARTILRCVKELPGSYGMQTLCDLLRGSKNEKNRRLAFQKMPAYGTLKGTDANWLKEILYFLVMEGYLSLSGGLYPVLSLGSRAQELERRKSVLIMKVPAKATPSKQNLSKSREISKKKPDQELFERLRLLRSRLAFEQHIPAYLVFSNAALEDMCAKLPETPAEFLLVSGVGENKLQRYGADFLGVISEYLREKGRQ